MHADQGMWPEVQIILWQNGLGRAYEDIHFPLGGAGFFSGRRVRREFNSSILARSLLTLASCSDFSRPIVALNSGAVCSSKGFSADIKKY